MYTYICIYVHKYMYICMYIYMYIIYIYIYYSYGIRACKAILCYSFWDLIHRHFLWILVVTRISDPRGGLGFRVEVNHGHDVPLNPRP